MILSVQNLSKQYLQGDLKVEALKNVSFDLVEGETLSVVGASGSGKTTLLSLLAGLDTPSGGMVTIAGKNISTMEEKPLSEFRSLHMGIVFQQFHLMPYMSAFENVCLPLEISEQDSVESRALEALSQVGLSDRRHHRPDQLSGGERQRVAIARAFVGTPKLLLADEPSGNLDTETGDRVMDLLFDLVKQHNMTLILVTHNPEHAKLCQRTVTLKGGVIQ